MFVYVLNKKRILQIGAAAAAVVVLMVLLVLMLSRRSAGTTMANPQTGALLPVYRVAQNEGDKSIALTFDAAWGTEQVMPILDILDRYEVRATFFIVGFWADQYSELVRAVVSRGHELGSHSTNHLHMTQLTREQIEADLSTNSQKLFALTGQTPKLFRAPFGEYNDLTLRIAAEQGMTPVQWSLDAMDWDEKTAEEITRRIVQKAVPGDIILMHINSQEVVKALPDVIVFLQGSGYQITPLSQMMHTGSAFVDKKGVQRPAAQFAQ